MARNRGQGEVGAGDHLPCRVDGGGDGSVQLLGTHPAVTVEVGVERFGGEGGERHALPVDRIEAAKAVTEADERIRPARGAVESTPNTGGKAERDRHVERLGSASDVAELA